MNNSPTHQLSHSFVYSASNSTNRISKRKDSSEDGLVMNDIENPDPENDILHQLTLLAETQVPYHLLTYLFTW